jgi:hypothetical protein
MQKGAGLLILHGDQTKNQRILTTHQSTIVQDNHDRDQKHGQHGELHCNDTSAKMAKQGNSDNLWDNGQSPRNNHANNGNITMTKQQDGNLTFMMGNGHHTSQKRKRRCINKTTPSRTTTIGIAIDPGTGKAK